MDSGQLNPSTGELNARYGAGQYFTDIPPEQIGARSISELPPDSDQMSLGQLARRLFGQSFAGGKLGSFLELDPEGLDIRQVTPNLFLRAGSDALDVTERIIRFGPTLE